MTRKNGAKEMKILEDTRVVEVDITLKLKKDIKQF